MLHFPHSTFLSFGDISRMVYLYDTLIIVLMVLKTKFLGRIFGSFQVGIRALV